MASIHGDNSKKQEAAVSRPAGDALTVKEQRLEPSVTNSQAGIGRSPEPPRCDVRSGKGDLTFRGWA